MLFPALAATILSFGCSAQSGYNGNGVGPGNANQNSVRDGSANGGTGAIQGSDGSSAQGGAGGGAGWNKSDASLGD
jgi:hypothetical protein